MTLDNLLSLIAGWVLGILSSIITDTRKKRSQKKEIKRGILAELRETQIILVSNCYLLNHRFGIFDRDFLTWILPYYQKFRRIDSSNNYQSVIDFINETLKLNDEQIAELIYGLRQREIQKKGGKSGLTLKKVFIPYADSKLGFLSLFEESFQRKILSIRRDIHFINEDIELAWYYFKKTFESLSDRNYKLIDENLNTTYLDVAGKTKRLTDKIEEIKSQY